MNNIIHCNYIPIQITPEISKYLYKQKCAGKIFASVKLENKNPYYRLKQGEVLEITNDSCLLEIETVNYISEDGYSTLMPIANSTLRDAIYPHAYEKIWFKMDELEKFEIYDEDGNIQQLKQKL
jgi:hypothetical protein